MSIQLLGKKAKKRYGDGHYWKRLNDVTTLLEVGQIYFEAARQIMLRDGHHATMFVLLKGVAQIDLIVAPPENRLAKYMLMRDVARRVRRIGADGLLCLGEIWLARPEDIPRGGFAVDAVKRGEALVLWGANAQGEVIDLSAEIERKKIKRHKVRRLQPTNVDQGGRIIFLAPVLEVWGKLDVLRLKDEDGWPQQITGVRLITE
jgi:hypothetical protein